jgi:hypothetical protein
MKIYHVSDVGELPEAMIINGARWINTGVHKDDKETAKKRKVQFEQSAKKAGRKMTYRIVPFVLYTHRQGKTVPEKWYSLFWRWTARARRP